MNGMIYVNTHVHLHIASVAPLTYQTFLLLSNLH